jgi:hypothetical protein
VKPSGLNQSRELSRLPKGDPSCRCYTHAALPSSSMSKKFLSRIVIDVVIQSSADGYFQRRAFAAEAGVLTIASWSEQNT